MRDCVMGDTPADLAGALRAAIRPRREEDQEEPMRYRTAFLGAVLGLLFLIGFAMRGGMGFKIALLFFAAHFATIAIPLTRLRAQIASRSIRPHSLDLTTA